MKTQPIDYAGSLQIVTTSLREVLEQSDLPVPDDITAETILVGQDAILDSLGIVTLIVDVEQQLETEHEISITLANDRAMSQRNSPFRTVGTLSEYVCELVMEPQP